MNRIKVYTIIILTIISFYSCNKEEVKPATTTFDVTSKAEFNSTLYPSLILGMSEIEKQNNSTLDLFSITINPNKEQNIKIVIQESKLNYETIILKNNISEPLSFTPTIKWKYDDLKYLSQPGIFDMTFICYSDNNEVDRKDLKLSYRAINECVLAGIIDGEATPLYYLLATYVNEDSPVIDGFLKEVLQSTNLNSFVGYQQGREKVLEQVESVFYTLRNKGIKYSSITNTSNTNPNIISQYVRFSDEVLNNTQANCADGTVFFCSVLQKIGIHTKMVFVPGHVYLGYYLDDAKTEFKVLETTLVGSYNHSFIEATNYNVNSFNASKENFDNEDFFDGYFLVDMDEARKIVKPLGR